MKSTRFLLNKFEVAERQLNQAIVLFFEGGDPVSIHTLAEAALQVLYDIRGELGAKSIFRDSDGIRDEYKKEWKVLLSKSRNFFKHADRDKGDTHEFKEEFNHFSLMDAVNMYVAGKQSWTPESITFFGWFAMTYPTVMKDAAEISAIVGHFQVRLSGIDHADRILFGQVIRELRGGGLVIPNVSLVAGLPKKQALRVKSLVLPSALMAKTKT